MVLCDTNILISAFNGRQDTIARLEQIGLDQIALSAVTVMELYQGMGNKREMTRMKNRIEAFESIPINEAISSLAIDLIAEYKLSHGLLIPDALIGATSIISGTPLFTYNVKDFSFMEGLLLFL